MKYEVTNNDKFLLMTVDGEGGRITQHLFNEDNVMKEVGKLVKLISDLIKLNGELNAN